MPLFWTRTGPVYFAHVPRTAGSNLTQYLAARFGEPGMLDRDWMRAWANGGWRSDSLISSPQHVTSADAARLVPGNAAIFSVVRDPVARVISEFRFQARRGLRRRRLTELGFSTWLRLVLRAARRDPRVFDNHLRPQVDMVPAGAEVFPLEAGHGPVIAWLDRIAGAPAPAVQIGSDEPGGFRGPVAPSRQDLQLIGEFYAADYARFGYAFPEPAEHPADRLAPLRSAVALAAAPAAVRMYFRGKL